MVYLEQIYIKLLNLIDNHCLLQWTKNTTSVISKWSRFTSFLSWFILFSVVPSNVIVPGVKSSR